MRRTTTAPKSRTAQKIQRLQNLINHPRTGEEERDAAQRMLKRVMDKARENGEQLTELTVTSAARAAAIFVAAFNHVFEDDDWMTISVRDADGTSVHITGRLVDYLMRFTPADAEMLLGYLARLLGDDQTRAVISVTIPSFTEDQETDEWAWHLSDTSALTTDEAASWLGSDANYRGAQYGYGLNGGAFGDPECTAVTDEVKNLLRARGLTGR